MSTIVFLPDQATAVMPKRSYLNNEHGLMSWLLTQDHKRIGVLYLITITLFFLIGGTFAGLIRLELLTPQPDLVASDTYNKLFTMQHFNIMLHFKGRLNAISPNHPQTARKLHAIP